MLFRLKLDIDPIITTMLDEIPQDRLIHGKVIDLSMGGGQFVREVERRKLAAGLTPKQIRDTVMGIAADEIDLSYVKRRNNLVGTYMVGNALTMDWKNMKFDVVLGNPPYQDSGKHDCYKLWNSFMDKSIELSVKGGYVALITPFKWIQAKTNRLNSYRLLEEYQVEKAVVYPWNDTPFLVGSSVSYHITHMVPRYKKTPVYFSEWSKRSEQHVADIDIRNEKLWPAELNEMNMSIHKKIQKFKMFKFIRSYGGFKPSEISDTQTEQYPFKFYSTNNIFRYTSRKSSRHAEWRVMIPRTSTLNQTVADHDCGQSADMFTIYVKNRKQAENARDLFRTNTYRFIANMYRIGKHQPIHGLLPEMSLDKKWTDEELFKIFDFNDDEIKKIQTTFR